MLSILKRINKEIKKVEDISGRERAYTSVTLRVAFPTDIKDLNYDGVRYRNIKLTVGPDYTDTITFFHLFDLVDVSFRKKGILSTMIATLRYDKDKTIMCTGCGFTKSQMYYSAIISLCSNLRDLEKKD